MADAPQDQATILANIQHNMGIMWQRANQADPAMTNLTALITEQLLPKVEEEIHNPEVEIPNPERTVSNPEMVALIAKIAKLEVAVSKSKKLGVGGIAMYRICLFPNAKLPERFKMQDFSKFNGTGDLKTHLLGYHVAMKLHGVQNDTMAQMFP